MGCVQEMLRDATGGGGQDRNLIGGADYGRGEREGVLTANVKTPLSTIIRGRYLLPQLEQQLKKSLANRISASPIKRVYIATVCRLKPLIILHSTVWPPLVINVKSSPLSSIRLRFRIQPDHSCLDS